MSRACNNISLNTAAMKEQVYEFVKNIPRGKVATYGQIALHLGIGTLPGWWGIFFIAILIRSISLVTGWSMLKGSFHDHTRSAGLRLKDACWCPKESCSRMSRLSI